MAPEVPSSSVPLWLEDSEVSVLRDHRPLGVVLMGGKVGLERRCYSYDSSLHLSQTLCCEPLLFDFA